MFSDFRKTSVDGRGLNIISIVVGTLIDVINAIVESCKIKAFCWWTDLDQFEYNWDRFIPLFFFFSEIDPQK